jgi:hypothetical protein
VGKERLCNSLEQIRPENRDYKWIRLTASGEAFPVGSDDLGLSTISANGGRLMLNLTEETRLTNSRLSSVDRLEFKLSSYDLIK